MSQSAAAAAPADGGHNGRTTLSDLLADDVRDYFLREGGGAAVVTDHTTGDFAPSLVASAPATTAAADIKRNVDGGRTRRRRRQRRGVKSDYDNTTSRNGNSEGANLLSTATIQTISSSSSCSDADDVVDDDGDGDENYSMKSRMKGLQSYKSYQQNHGADGGGREEQMRGQDTAERRDMNAIHHSIADAASQYPKNNMPRQEKKHQHQHQQRHTPHVSSFESESGNFHISHRQHDSFGSGSASGISSPSSYMGRINKSKYLSAADAEFLQRYAEEKERVSSRLSNLSPNSIQSNPSTMSPLSIHNKDQSPPPSRRPPTVMGSHRPALPSIDNDDWEEDDSIENGLSDRARKERQMKKKKKRKKKENDAKVAAAAAIRISNDRKIRSTFDHNQQPAGVSTPNISSGIDVAERHESRVMSPSQLNHHQHHTLQNSNHNREDSTGTFVRLRGFSPARSMGDGCSYGGSDSANNSVVSNIYHNSRPLSYLSGSSGSGSSDGGSISNHFRRETSTFFAAAAPATTDGISNSSGGSGYYQNRLVNNCNTSDFSNFNINTRYSSTDGSDFNSALLGYGVMNSPSSGRDELSTSPNNFARINNINQRTSRLQDTTMAYGTGVQGGDYLSLEDEESSSSDESHDTDEGEDSEGSSYAIGSGSSDSTSNSSKEFQKQPLFRRSSSKGGLVRWNLSNFDKVGLIQNNVNNPDIKGGEKGSMPSSERERLVGGPNHSSMGRADAARSQISGGGGSSSSKVRTTTKNDRQLPHSSGKRAKKKARHQHHRLGGSGWPLRLDDAFEVLRRKMSAIFVAVELLISNMPSLVGSLALAWCSLGVDWFKWYEDDACQPTHYHSDSCVFSEFPGCFVCDTDNDGYQFAVRFHYMCSAISFILSSLLLGKIMIAFPVVRDELANPTTAAPLGLLCMAIEKVFGGNFGSIGMGITFFSTALHTVVACWFIFISVVYKTLPEPSWFPNTTGIGLAAVKVYLYWTGGGYFLSGFSILAFIMFYFVSLFRIHTNEKISVPVCWAQLGGPAVVLYGFTIFGQPGSKEDDLVLLIPENKEHFYQIHHQYYMPVLHVLFALCMVSMASSLYLLRARWQPFREKEFSPAHVSFCAPLAAHVNALQTYRSSLKAFSSPASGKTFKARHSQLYCSLDLFFIDFYPDISCLLLYHYWTLSLLGATLLVLIMTWKFFVHLPSWCQINVDDDEMPPEPDKTIVTQLLQKGNIGDSMKQHLVSAAVLQANESGALVRVLQDGRMKYVRSRRDAINGL
ncbi:hypothetical protein ACHAW5_008415 [Stephanodiscus triporus]|uniref:Uncharacterized protein n=1 Tax=Stephanodiscus triporus TaxID=2934178 RepID=A0ABD3QRY0_9STRA